MSEWQPIETAPKDGRELLLYGLRAGEISGIADAPSIDIGFHGRAGDYVGFEWALSAGDGYAVWHRPTHWMPLPPPPKEQA